MKHAAQTSEKCSVSGCKNDSERSLPGDKVKSALPELQFEGEGRKIALCKEHYKAFKKATKDERKVERAYW